MATTHILPADTRMEDLPGLASGDTIALGGHVLTCGSNLSAITGLYATGSGTIRLLNGGNCDFSGSNPLPATITIEGGTDDNPLPAHGDYGYPCRAAACITLRDAVFYGRISIHCIGNSSRPHVARVEASSATGATLDRDMELEAGDVLVVLLANTWANIVPYVAVVAWDASVFQVSHASRSAIPVGSWVVLATAGFVIRNGRIGGPVSGGELAMTRDGSGICGKSVSPSRLVAIPEAGRLINPGQSSIFGAPSSVSVDILVASQTISCSPGFISCGKLFCGSFNGPARAALTNILVREGGVQSNTVFANTRDIPCGGRLDVTDMVLPSNLYSSLEYSDELIIRSTNPQSCVIHRASGIATLVDRTDIEIPTSLPDAWRLDPIEDGTAWHDVPMTVLPGKTLSCIWYWMLGEEGTTAGCQILDGEGPGWGSIAMNPGMAEVLAETTVPDGASPLRPFVAVPISWRNPGREIRKVVLRGWARGGTAYSRIDPAAGGLA